MISTPIIVCFQAILQHASQFSDPRRHPTFWQHWREFEEAHGNEDTFRDMLRVRRAVETAYSQVNYLAQDMLAGEAASSSEAKENQNHNEALGLDAFQRAESQLRVENYKRSLEDSGEEASKRRAVADKSESTVHEDGDEEDMQLQLRPVPAAVFGSVAM